MRNSMTTTLCIRPARGSGLGRLLDSVARGDVAQLGEHRVRIAGVRGSSPLISTTPFSDHRSSGKVASPAGWIRPSRSSRRASSRFVGDQVEPGRRGTKRIA